MPRVKHSYPSIANDNTITMNDETIKKCVEVVGNEVDKTINSTKDLPQGARIAVVHGLKANDYSMVKIAEITGLSYDTVATYLDTTIPDKFLRFSGAIQNIFTERQFKLKAEAIDAASEKLKDLTQVKLFEVSGLIKVLSELENGRAGELHTSNHATIINIHPALAKREIVEAE